MNGVWHQALESASGVLRRYLRADGDDPLWADRDRVFSSGGEEGVAVPGGPALALGVAAGAALAERNLARVFGRSLVDHRCWLLAVPEALAGGLAFEAAAAAARGGMGKLGVLAPLGAGDPRAVRMARLGWKLIAVEGMEGCRGAIEAGLRASRPVLLALDPAGDWSPGEALPPKASGRRSWLRRLARHAQAEAFRQSVSLPPLARPGPPSPAGDTVAATLREAVAALPSPAIMTIPDELDPGLAGAVALGAALHGGVVPVLTGALQDGLLPSMRLAGGIGLRILAALEAQGAPARNGAALWGAVEGVRVFRPADPEEALDCLDSALRFRAGPSLLLAPPSSATGGTMPRGACARGAYARAEARLRRDVTLIASGSALGLALAARARLAAQSIDAAVVSLPCWTLFAAQAEEWRERLLGEAPRLGVDCGDGFGWERWLGRQGAFRDAASLASEPDPAAALAQAALLLCRPGLDRGQPDV